MLLDLRSLWESQAGQAGGSTAIVNVIAEGAGVAVQDQIITVVARPVVRRRRITARGDWVAPAAELEGRVRVRPRVRVTATLTAGRPRLVVRASTSLVRVEDEELAILLAAMR